MNLEEHFLYSDFIKADELFICDNVCFISKNYIKSKALKLAKNSDNVIAETKGAIPMEKGTDFSPAAINTKCLLCPNETIGIVYNTKYLFNYEYVKMLIKQIPYYENTQFYVAENKRKEPVLQLYNEKDELIGGLIAMVRKKNARFNKE